MTLKLTRRTVMGPVRFLNFASMIQHDPFTTNRYSGPALKLFVRLAWLCGDVWQKGHRSIAEFVLTLEARGRLSTNKCTRKLCVCVRVCARAHDISALPLACPRLEPIVVLVKLGLSKTAPKTYHWTTPSTEEGQLCCLPGRAYCVTGIEPFNSSCPYSLQTALALTDASSTRRKALCMNLSHAYL